MDRNQLNGMSSLSPYMNFDPAILNFDSEPQFIMPEGASQHRGRFELAFSQIGGSICLGAGLGGAAGFYQGFSETKLIETSVRRTQILNFITKRGAASAQTLGVIALLYSIFGVIISKVRGAEDELNTLAAATVTGLVYKSTGGLKKAGRGGLVGLGLASAYCLLTSRDRIKSIFRM